MCVLGIARPFLDLLKAYPKELEDQIPFYNSANLRVKEVLVSLAKSPTYFIKNVNCLY